MMRTTRRTLLAVGAAATLEAIAKAPGAAAAPVVDTAACPEAPPEAFTLTLSAQTAAVNDTIAASAALPSVIQGGTPAPLTRTLELWWDLDPSQWWTALTGSPVSATGEVAQRVASLAVATGCAFDASFTVPSVNPGIYGVVAIAFDALAGAESYAPAYLTVQ